MHCTLVPASLQHNTSIHICSCMDCRHTTVTLAHDCRRAACMTRSVAALARARRLGQHLLRTVHPAVHRLLPVAARVPHLLVGARPLLPLPSLVLLPYGRGGHCSSRRPVAQGQAQDSAGHACGASAVFASCCAIDKELRANGTWGGDRCYWTPTFASLMRPSTCASIGQRPRETSPSTAPSSTPPCSGMAGACALPLPLTLTVTLTLTLTPSP